MTSEAYNVTLADEYPYLEPMEAADTLWENTGWLIRGRAADGFDVTLWAALYHLKGAPHVSSGSIATKEVCFPQTVLVAGHFAGRERVGMADNQFVAAGTHWTEHLPGGALAVRESDGSVIWQVADREHHAAPPRWRVRGDHSGVSLDLEMEALCPAFWMSELEMLAGFEVPASIRGTVSIDGRTHRIRGFGQHEKFRLINPNLLFDSRGRGPWKGGLWWQWHCGFNEDLQVFLYSQPASQQAVGRVITERGVEEFDWDEISFEENAYWDDPRSGVAVPCRFTIDFSNHAGARLQLQVRSYARAYYLWDYLHGGYNLLYWNPSIADGVFVDSQGLETRFRDMLYLAHTKRLFLTLPVVGGSE
jgi:hypothetical protein